MSSMIEAKRTIETLVEVRRKSLVRAMRQLVQQLTEKAERIEKGGYVNSCGEIQGYASEIDAKCGVLAATMEMVELFSK